MVFDCCLRCFVAVAIGVGDRGAGGAAALPTLEKFAKISHNQAENRPKIGQNFSKQWIFYRAAPLNFISAYAHGCCISSILLLFVKGDLFEDNAIIIIITRNSSRYTCPLTPSVGL